MPHESQPDKLKKLLSDKPSTWQQEVKKRKAHKAALNAQAPIGVPAPIPHL